MTGRNRPSLESLLGDLYASMNDAERFPVFAAKLRMAMNAHLVALQTDEAGHVHHVLRNFAADPIEVKPADRADDGSANLYFVRGAAQFLSKGVIDGATLFAPGELERTEFYRQQLCPFDVHWSMGFCLSSVASGELVALSVSRDKRRPAFEPDAMHLAHRLLPHLQNVYDMQQRLQVGDDLSTGMDCLAFGVWLVGRDGLVVHANAGAQRLVGNSRAGMTQRGRLLQPGWRADRPDFQRALACATNPITCQRAELLLHDGEGQAWAACSVHPLPHRGFSGWRPATHPVAIVFVHPLVQARPSNAALRHVFGLTPAEAELACALLRHGSLSSCIGTLGKQRETLRSQIKVLFAKTDTHRQSDLIRRLQAAAG